jgi:hypothetical protein
MDQNSNNNISKMNALWKKLNIQSKVLSDTENIDFNKKTIMNNIFNVGIYS